MQTAGDRNAASVEAYIDSIDEKRRDEFRAAFDSLSAQVPDGYDLNMTWGFPTFEVPMDVSGPTYNKKPLMFAALAAQKNHLGLYVMCAYMSEDRMARLEQAWKAHGSKLDRGKACIRFKSNDEVPWDAVGREIDLTPAEFADAATKARDEAIGKGKRA
ncbi:DUF1801 domain-containing protein [Sphingomicrobium sediminis]|uniref:DUF1801 domain-containing protein n=1 Tax=Sphingomicrobium sediminis TaxID=2950949 RepID=A0A9X2J3V4_9SPHN|nr:DUF1801 domain-containing protein [Sphingomicrobium sediminis]MCM8557711.1 DUF1801 domain-containing protein [Sphingomicrobium sediminis]